MKWKYQERTDSSLTGQPFIGKLGKERGNAYANTNRVLCLGVGALRTVSCICL